MRMKEAFALSIVVCCIFILGLNGTTNAQAVKPATIKVTRTEKLLREAKAPYAPFQGEGSFYVSYQGKVKKDIDVIIIEAGPAVVLFVDAAAGRDIDLTPEKMRKLLEFNSGSDYIKVGISDIGSIRVQSEQHLSLINAKVLKEILDQMAAGADEVAGIIGPIKQKATGSN